MRTSVVEIASPGLYLSKSRGFLSIKSCDGGVERLPLDEIGVLVITSPQATLSTALMNTLSDRGIIAVLCDSKHRPVSYLYPYQPHEELTGRLLDQIIVSKPLKKRLWQSIIRQKIIHQSMILALADKRGVARLRKLASEISSGDKENREAQAAKVYWQSLLGKSFRRVPRGDGINRILDFGYGILRSAMLRAIAGSGVNPSLGLSHISRRNPFCLADDLMEPYRPTVDIVAYRLSENKDFELGPKEKRALSLLPAIPLSTSQGLKPLNRSMLIMTQTLVKSYSAKKNLMEIPQFPETIFQDIDYLWQKMDLG